MKNLITTLYVFLFASAEKSGVRIQATLSVPEHPNSEEDLTRYSHYVKQIVIRYKSELNASDQERLKTMP